MNTIDEKCAVLAKTPSERWFELRFKPLIQLLLTMQEDGLISIQPINWSNLLQFPPFIVFTTYAFKYDGSVYVLGIEQSHQLECFSLEKAYLPPQFQGVKLERMLFANTVLSSDDDLTFARVILAASQRYGYHNLDDIINALDPIFKTGSYSFNRFLRKSEDTKCNVL